MPTIPVIYHTHRFGGYTPATDDADRSIVISPVGPHPRLTLLHEIGHYLDDRIGGFSVYSSTQPGSILTDVLRNIDGSHAVRQMRTYLADATNIPNFVNYQLRDWLEPVEIWARAYAQYIVSRSESFELRTELTVAIEFGGIKIYRNVQWETDDFARIAESIDEVFQRLGWRG